MFMWNFKDKCRDTKVKVPMRFCPQFSFVGYQVERLVFCLSDVRPSVLSPAQSVLLFERCRLLLVCLRHSSQLSQHLCSHYREEFRSEGNQLKHTPVSSVRLTETQILFASFSRCKFGTTNSWPSRHLAPPTGQMITSTNKFWGIYRISLCACFIKISVEEFWVCECLFRLTQISLNLYHFTHLCKFRQKAWADIFVLNRYIKRKKCFLCSYKHVIDV